MSVKESGNISFADVALQMRYTSRHYGFQLHYDVRPPWRADGRVALMVRLVARRDRVGNAPVVEYGVSGEFPCSGSKTFAGLMLKLCFQLERKLDEAALDAERAAATQQRLL